MITTQYDYLIIGGDSRQVYLSSILKDRGYRTIVYEQESQLQLADHIIGPIPFINQKQNIFHKCEMEDISVSHFMSLLNKGQTLFAGCIPDSILALAKANNIACFDFMKEDSIAVLNSIATAEGAIAEAIKQSPSNLHDSRVLILGYGRCGKTLGEKIKHLVKTTTVSVRTKLQEATAISCGLEAIMIDDLHQVIGNYDFVFNTIPQLILDTPLLKEMKQDTVIVDLASNPGGVNFQAAKQLELNATLYPGLPGIYSPKSSAEILADYIIEKRNERRNKT